MCFLCINGEQNKLHHVNFVIRESFTYRFHCDKNNIRTKVYFILFGFFPEFYLKS